MPGLCDVYYKQPKIVIPLFTLTNWSGLANQPNNDGVEVVSNSASDVCYCTIWGNTHGTNQLCSETITLNGTTFVPTTKTDWDNIYAVILSDKGGNNLTRAVGTITIREASGDAAITTITATNFHAGMFILAAPGMNFEIESFSGNIWWTTLQNTTVPTTLTGIKEVGQTNIAAKTKELIMAISDNTGCSMQCTIFDN